MRGEEQTDPHIYRIGAVSRLTSIPTGTIRVWERRYGVVEPGRSDGGFRLYSHRDVERLRVIKSLIEHGETISGLAGLSLHQLKQRVHAHGIAVPEPLQHPLEVGPEPSPEPAGRASAAATMDMLRPQTLPRPDFGLQAREPLGSPLRVVSTGQGMSVAMRVASTSLKELQLVGALPDWRGQDAEIARLQPDLLVLEQPSIHIDTADELHRLVRTSGARHVLLVYQFGSEAALRALEVDRVTPVRGPLNATQLQLAVRLATERQEQPQEDARSQRFIEAIDQRPPPPRFDAETIARIAAQSRVVHCECPQHLATLISSLLAFEAYCRECENRSEDDATLHAALERATGQARSTLEDALDYLLQVENIVP